MLKTLLKSVVRVNDTIPFFPAPTVLGLFVNQLANFRSLVRGENLNVERFLEIGLAMETDSKSSERTGAISGREGWSVERRFQNGS